MLDYLSRYTHRVGISNHRIISVQDEGVTFTYRDRADGETVKRMSLAPVELIRRFLLHVLPDGFVKIRYFGFMAHRHKRKYIDLIRKLIDPDAKVPEKIKETVIQLMQRLTGIDITKCPRCKNGQMIPHAVLAKVSESLFADTS